MSVLIRAGEYRRVPWKNGRGFTLEIARFPDEGEFDWRISRAAVVENGPFSRFEGYDRWIVPVTGAGMRLRHDSGPWVEVGPLHVHHFTGGAATDCELTAGAIEDLNLIVRHGRAGASMRVFSSTVHEPHPFHAYVVSGSARCGAAVASAGDAIVSNGGTIEDVSGVVVVMTVP